MILRFRNIGLVDLDIDDGRTLITDGEFPMYLAAQRFSGRRRKKCLESNTRFSGLRGRTIALACNPREDIEFHSRVSSGIFIIMVYA